MTFSSGQSWLDLYSVGLNAKPSWATNFLESKDLKSRGQKILSHLRYLATRANRGEISLQDSYKTKVQLTEALFPNEFQLELPGSDSRLYDYRRLKRKECIEKTGAAIRSLSKEIRKNFNQISDSQKGVAYLNSCELIVRVGVAEKESLLFGYHSPELPQPLEILRNNWEFMKEHIEKQSVDELIARTLYLSATQPVQTVLPLTINTDFDTPDEEMEGHL